MSDSNSSNSSFPHSELSRTSPPLRRHQLPTSILVVTQPATMVNTPKPLSIRLTNSATPPARSNQTFPKWATAQQAEMSMKAAQKTQKAHETQARTSQTTEQDENAPTARMTQKKGTMQTTQPLPKTGKTKAAQKMNMPPVLTGWAPKFWKSPPAQAPPAPQAEETNDALAMLAAAAADESPIPVTGTTPRLPLSVGTRAPVAAPASLVAPVSYSYAPPAAPGAPVPATRAPLFTPRAPVPALHAPVSAPALPTTFTRRPPAAPGAVALVPFAPESIGMRPTNVGPGPTDGLLPGIASARVRAANNLRTIPIVDPKYLKMPDIYFENIPTRVTSSRFPTSDIRSTFITALSATGTLPAPAYALPDPDENRDLKLWYHPRTDDVTLVEYWHPYVLPCPKGGFRTYTTDRHP